VIEVRSLTEAEREWALEARRRRYAGVTSVARRGELLDPDQLPALVALRDGEPVGLVTLRFDEDGCEALTVDAFELSVGVGRALIEGAAAEARRRGCRRLWLVTTNDNLPALRAYQRYGLRLVAVAPGAVDEARRTLKPEIPLMGIDGIPIRDELELELELR
jgi:GNAT superfamily N-acetyltransferase